MACLPIVRIYALGDIEASTGSGPMQAHVMAIEHLREAPAVHDALMQAVAEDLWEVKNLEQLEAARGMELALGKMAGALATIRGGGGDLGSAVDELDKYTKEFAHQGLFGTARTLGAVAEPALEVVRRTRAALHQEGLYDLVADRLRGLVDTAASMVERAREFHVSLDPEEVPLVVKSVRDIAELAPSSDDDAPSELDEDAWCIGRVVVVTGLEQMHEASDMRFALLHNKDSKGWRVFGGQNVRQVEALTNSLDCLWGNLTKIRRSEVLFDPVAREVVLNNLDRDAYSLFDEASTTDALRRDPGTVSGLCEVPGQVHKLVELARVQPIAVSEVRKLAGYAKRVIELIRGSPVFFCMDNEMP